MTIPVAISNNTKIYNVTGCAHHRLPDWIVRKHAKKLKKDVDWSRRVQLLQDFEFPEASVRIALTGDQQHIVATGVYKPQFRVFELAETALKFERHTAAETVAMTLLGEDWRKLALLQSDRYVEFHSPSGLYHSTRIPKMGRDMTYDWWTCDLLVGASSSELYRLNLDRGQFMAPLETGATAVNCVRVSPLHGLYGLACDKSIVEFWDRRDRNRLGAVAIERSVDWVSSNAQAESEGLDVTAIHFLPDGLHWAAGTSDGRVLLFDLRMQNRSLDVYDHYNGYAIKKIDYHQATGCLVSADQRGIKFWSTQGSISSQHQQQQQQQRLFTAIDSDVDVHDFCLQAGTGLVLVANEGPPVSAYFIPRLGPAPRWCSFLENLTEEMEEGTANGTTSAVYDNFKFVTRAELAQLGLEHLMGSNLLRPYMHGYFIDIRLWEKARAIANPFAYEEYMTKRKAEKLEKERQSRIRAADPLRSAKVNRRLAVKLATDADLGEDGDHEHRNSSEDVGGTKKEKRQKEMATNILKDDRFASLFNDPDFEIDDTSKEYQHLHPAASGAKSSSNGSGRRW